MILRSGISILFRLCMMALFFVGLTWVIRAESLWNVFSGVVLMLTTVPLSYAVGAVIAGDHRFSLQTFREMFSSTFPLVGPIVLLFVFLSLLEFYARFDDARAFLLMPFILIPLFVVLVDVMSGSVPCDPVAISRAYTDTLLQMIARMAYLATGLLLLVFAVFAVVSLFISLGDLLRQGLFSSGAFTTPVLCQFPVFQGEHCSRGLLAWHGVSLVALVIAWRYGHQILLKIDSLLLR